MGGARPNKNPRIPLSQTEIYEKNFFPWKIHTNPSGCRLREHTIQASRGFAVSI